jgi:hypothetical protein
VRALRSVLERAHLIVPFDPQLPWFRSLEGHPGYAQLLAERQRRIDEARTEMRALEAQYPESVIVKTLRSGQTALAWDRDVHDASRFGTSAESAGVEYAVLYFSARR